MATSKASSRQDRRWLEILSDATWPAVLRNYVVGRLHNADVPLVTPDVAAVADSLRTRPLDALEPQETLQLLSLVCDEVLDTQRVRDLLQERLDSMDEVRAAVFLSLFFGFVFLLFAFCFCFCFNFQDIFP